MRLLPVLVWLAAGLFAAEPAVRFERTAGRIDVLVDGRPFTAFHFGPEWPKPFVHPLRTARGTVISRGFPLEKIPGESQDHVWHRGLWYGHGDINGVDFWREGPGVKFGHLALRAEPHTELLPGAGRITAVLDLAAPDGGVLGSIEEEFTFSGRGEIRLIDARMAIRADRGAGLKLGDTEDGGFAVRLATPFREERGAVLSNSEGGEGARIIWGKRARWVDYSARVGEEMAGVAIFDHPGNPRHPTWWHARGYSLNAANPFGERDFTGDKSRDGSMTVPAGGKLEFRYRVVLHPGSAREARMQEEYENYARSR